MTDTTRTTRETRASGTRKKVWTPPAKLSTPEAPEGYQYRWVRHSMAGLEDNSGNVQERLAQGYELVRSEEIADSDIVQTMEDGKHAGTVRSGDLLLMKVPLEIVEQRNSHYQGKARVMQAAADRELDSNDSDLAPITKTRKTKVIRGNSRFQNDD